MSRPRNRLTVPQRFWGLLSWQLSKWLGLRLYLVHRRPLFPSPKLLADKPSDYEFGEPGEAQLLRIASDPTLDLSPQFVRGAFERGDRCFVTFVRGVLVAYYWFSTAGQVPLSDELDFVFDPGTDACAYTMLTHPEYRGRRVQQYNIANADACVSVLGHTHVVGYVSSDNFSSRAALSKVPGIELLGFVGAIRAFGRLWTFQTPGVRRAGIALEPRDEAVLEEGSHRRA